MIIDLKNPSIGGTYSLQTNLQTFYWEDTLIKPIVDPKQSFCSPIEENDKTQSIPRPISFEFSIDYTGNASAVLIVSQNPDLSSPVEQIPIALTDTIYMLYNLMIDKQYYWAIILRDTDTNIEIRSQIGSFYTENRVPRWINIPGLINVRDIGGHITPDGKKIRQGMIFRGNAAEFVNEDGIKAAKKLGIKTEVELRFDFEEGNASPFGEDVEYVVCGSGGYTIRRNTDQIPSYRKLFKLFADRTKYPFYIHCFAGADRTGTVAHMLHALFGISREVRAADYEQTSLSENSAFRNRNTEPYRDWLFNDLRSYQTDENTSDQECITRYFLSIGVTADELQAIRDILLEDC